MRDEYKEASPLTEAARADVHDGGCVSLPHLALRLSMCVTFVYVGLNVRVNTGVA